MKVAWATDISDIGWAYGFSLGNKWGKECLRMNGVSIDSSAKIALHHCPPNRFRPLKNKINVLWTAWEFHVLPPWESEPLKDVDFLCVTAKFLVPTFKLYCSCPVSYVPQGIDIENFFPLSNRYHHKIFRVLWIGAPNDRKGYQYLLGAWRAFADEPRMELYLKTTTRTGKKVQEGNIIFDGRDVDISEMRSIYQSADVFVLPSMGEGFGFSLGEAMACALPCIYTPCTSLNDLADKSCAIPVKAHYNEQGYKLTRTDVREGIEKVEEDGKTCVRVPAWDVDATDLAFKIIWVKEHRAKSRKLGRKAAQKIREHLTWKQAGYKLKKVLEAIPQGE